MRIMPIEFTDEERHQLRKLLRETIWADRYPLSPRVQALKRALAKLEPEKAGPPVPPRQPPRPVSDLELMLRASVAGEEGAIKARVRERARAPRSR